VKRTGGIGRPKKHAIKQRDLDIMFSKIIRSRGICQAQATYRRVACGGYLQAAHIEGRVNRRLRWDEDNALALCSGHHRWFSGRPVEWTTFVSIHFPRQFHYVLSVRNELVKPDYKVIHARLKARLDAIEGVA